MSEARTMLKLAGPPEFAIRLLSLLVLMGLTPTITVSLLGEQGEVRQGSLTITYVIRNETVAPIWMLQGTLESLSQDGRKTDSADGSKPQSVWITYNTFRQLGTYLPS